MEKTVYDKACRRNKVSLTTILVVVFMGNIMKAQNVFEFSTTSDLIFEVYSDDENKLRKVTGSTIFKSSSPEEIARSYFFATSNEDLSSLFLDKTQFTPKDDAHFENIKNTPTEDMYLQLLHKTSYNFQGNQMSYIMFIAQIKDVNFPFPTLLSLTKKGDKWLIHSIPNQQKIRESLMMFKPCVLSNIIEGNSPDQVIKELIESTKTLNNGIDFNLLFDKLTSIQDNEDSSKKLTMSDNMDCTNITSKEIVIGKYYQTGLFENANIKDFKNQNDDLISQIENNNDSIVLTNHLSFIYSDKTYSAIKYDRIKTNGLVTKEFTRLDKNGKPEEPAKQLLFLFQNLKTNIFSDLTPRMNKTPIMESNLYKETRGTYDVLNISKLFNLYLNNEGMFSSYLY